MRIRALIAAVAALLVLGGCADGAHPGAAAVVGDTEIPVSRVDEVNRAVSDALGQPLGVEDTLNVLIRGEVVDQVLAGRSVSISPAEVAAATPIVVNSSEAVSRLTNGAPAAKEFLDAYVRTFVGVAKLGGGTVTDNAAMNAGDQVLSTDAKSIPVTVNPRYGKWNVNQIQAGNGSLSTLVSKPSPSPGEADQQGQP